MGERKLRRDVNLQESLKQKSVKQMGVKQGVDVCVCDLCTFFFLTFTKTALKYPNDLLLHSSDERQ